MTNEQFEALVGRLERQACRQPGWYRVKVLLLAMLGNCYVAMMLLVVLGLFLGLLGSIVVLKALAAKLIIIVGAFLWMIVRALWVTMDPPAGTEIRARQAPEVFTLITELRRRLGAPRFHHLLITDEFNAGVVQLPRLGIFGWPRNYLLLGLPLMKTLTVDQFKAVLAHEFGHLAKGHGRMSNWIYCQRLRWSRLLTVLDTQKSWGSFLFKPFLTWFAPYFGAYSFPMARANEYEADAISARLTSPQTAAQALTGVNVIGSFLSERYWPQIYKGADRQPQPGYAPYRSMSQGVTQHLDQESAQRWLQQAMADKTDLADTHPALADRLKAIGQTPILVLPASGQTADRLLGEALEAVTEGFEQRWREKIQPSWEERYHEVQEGLRRLAELDAQYESGAELTPQEAYDRACLTESMGNNHEHALAQFQALHQRLPDSAVVCLSLGARLLDRDDDGGCQLIEKAIHLDESATADGCELLRDYHWRQGNEEMAHNYHRRMVEYLEIQAAAEQERSEVRLSDTFQRHDLPAKELAALCDSLRGIPGLGKAYLVKKRVKHRPESPCYILGFKATRWWQLHNKQRVQEVQRRIQETVRLSDEMLIISLEGSNYRFGRKFFWMRGSRIL